MKGFLRHILIQAGVFAVITMFSCSTVDEPSLEEGSTSSLSGIMVFNVSAVSNTGISINQNAPEEKIKSLRVIVISDGFIEINEKVSVPEAQADESFSYAFNRQSVEGIKEFFFIANEESIGQVSFQSTTLPSGVQNGMSLNDLWEIFPVEKIPLNDDSSVDTSKSGQGKILAKVLNAMFFNPTLGSYDVDTSNTIYLPYSVYYGPFDIGINEKTGELTGLEDKTFYLVPVATKFEFQFISKRPNPVSLYDLKVSKFDNLNFVYAQVGETDYKKTLPDQAQPLYWPDWLVTVARASWNNNGSMDQNQGFNEKYGWISDYSMPGSSIKAACTFPLNEDGDTWIIPGITKQDDGKITAGKLIIGPFYVPESNNNGNNVKVQQYGLNFTLKDKGTGSEFKFENDDKGSPVPISNLGALFRDTHVIIKVIMNEGEALVDGVYAELVPWKIVRRQGFVGGYVN